jgi:hypothetical protein
MDRWGVLGLLRELGQLAGKQDKTGYWNRLREAKYADEHMPTERRGSSWSGAADGEVIRAPWRGEYDMPGNFERGQRMGNSLANDALLREGLSYEYGYDPGRGVDVTYQPGVPLGGPGGARHNEQFTRGVTLSGPPDTAKQISQPHSPGNWDPIWDWVGPGTMQRRARRAPAWAMRRLMRS